jgi:hypothetical protein
VIAIVFTALTVQATHEQVALSGQSQITDRFTKAVDQLAGADSAGGSTERRLGGIYALERIAFDSPADQPTVVEVLTAFIRTRSPRVPDTPCQQISTDIQAAISVLSRRAYRPDAHSRINLSYTCLRGADFSETPRRYDATPPDTKVNGADFGGADFVGADLSEAIMPRVHLPGANMEKAVLTSANLDYAILRSTYLVGADLTNAKLPYATVDGSTMLAGAVLTGADLTDVDIAAADHTNVPQ